MYYNIFRLIPTPEDELCREKLHQVRHVKVVQRREEKTVMQIRQPAFH